MYSKDGETKVLLTHLLLLRLFKEAGQAGTMMQYECLTTCFATVHISSAQALKRLHVNETS